ncbi:putative N-methylcoclaurine 3'-monooxygenase [Helianthus annuus]|uniref:Putative (S)-N-methylcoclaurine 3'-hydroxylase isozyme 2 n=1 Tax=Helianthus annuus TaxID=4232 RepID=A0A251UI65_HELAN|nr:probable (S)-N-methylcoclaurine 3'-hydroxylase isozyme 2 [Helianthus annuus]KAJ0501901.1 putative N-methylcoclaurine 3'-monooxygenase [Helianthus annuus]KAJ0509830.1 putative N-methylcoclaurine 3'-monooxygenase [Helianthus annuus]KAJ0517829.1 putative N-methylcoclaurine 3'-monooxygenase [Helianthus annuus]KAJ0685846.1 putative N-methylcoclaurine 3'-monooxygenase [Helianthus annuus]KAJ0689716.1 putative N-methylcoclaurine 3'-monooxygenase [Helianthus annuus]
MSFSLFLLLTPLFLVFIIRKYLKSGKKLPPGPRPWPIIGNLNQVGKNPHVSTAILAQEHGGLISLHLGTQVLIVASSPEAAMGILRTQDRFLSSRFVPSAFHSNYLPFALIWSLDCNENWKSLRTLCRIEMFSVKALEYQSSLREEKLAQMIDFLRRKKGQVVNIEEVVFTTMFNTLSNIFFGKDFLDLEDQRGTASGLKEKLIKILENGLAPNISDFFPILQRLDLQGLRKQTLRHVDEVFDSWVGIINERRSVAAANKEHCFLDCLIENGFSNEQINVLALELFTAGTDTTTSTIEWAMAELIKNKNVMFELQEELKHKINSNTIVESEISNLPYLNACIKETLRLHPPAPLLLPHRAIQTCEVLNYTIPRGAQILVNIWAIGRDPKIWEDPLSFKPERFLGSSLDFRGKDFEFIPFGAGRRMCPGLPSGITSVQSILASLILRFDWILPSDQDPVKLDMNEKFGVTLQKNKPLQLIFKHLN